MLSKDQILSILHEALKSASADQAELVYDGEDFALTHIAESQIQQNLVRNDCSIIARVINGKKIGVASTNSFVKEDLEKALLGATEIARNQKENPDFPGLPTKQDFSSVNTYFEKTARFSPTQRAEAVKKIFDKAKALQLTCAGSFSTGDSEIAVVNTKGVACYQPLTSAYLNLIVMGDNSSGFSDQLSRDVDLIEVDNLAEIAIKKCVESKDPKDLDPGEYQVILEPSAVAALVEWMNYIGFGSKSFQEETSFLSNQIGQKIMG